MAVGSGIGAQLGWATESTYGTYVAPTSYLPAKSFQFTTKQSSEDVVGLAAGREAAIARVVTATWGEVAFEMLAFNKGLGRGLAHMFGSAATPVQQAGSAAYLQTHVWGDSAGRSLSIQGGFPDTAGTSQDQSALGVKLRSMEFKQDARGLLSVSYDGIAKSLTEAQTLGSASYVAANPFHFGQWAVKLGTFGAEASVTGVRSGSVKFTRPVDEEMFYAGNAGLMAPPVWNDLMDASGTLEVDFATKADFLDRYVANSATSMVLEWVGPIIASSYAETLRFKLPKVHFGEIGQAVPDNGVLKLSVPFKAYKDLTNGTAIAEYMSTDTTV